MGVEFGPGSLAGALGLLGVGIAMIFPDNKWIGGIFVLAAIVVLFFDIRITGWQLSGHTPITRGRPLALWGMIVFGAALIVCAVWYFRPILPDENQKLPGFTSYAVIRLYDSPEFRRRYVYEFVASEGAKVSFYLSASSIFTFAATDLRGESYPLEVKVGGGGIPIDQFVVLFCEVGVTENSTVMRVLVNEKEVARRDLNFPLNLGKMDWKPGALGAPMIGTNQGGVFLLSEMGIYGTTMTSAEVHGLVENATNFYSPAAIASSGSQSLKGMPPPAPSPPPTVHEAATTAPLPQIIWFKPDDIESVFGFLQAPDGSMLVSNLRADGTSKVHSPMTDVKAWFEPQIAKEPIVLGFVNYDDPDGQHPFIPTSERYIEPGAEFALGYLVPRIDPKNPRGVPVADFLRIYGGLIFHFEYKLNGVPQQYSYAYPYETIAKMLGDRERKWNEDHKRRPGLQEYPR